MTRRWPPSPAPAGAAPPCLADHRAGGIGKALFADKAALRVLAEAAGPPVDAPGLDVPDEHPAARLVAAGSHPDLMRLERLTKEGGTELARSITVDQVRGLQRLFATTASMSPWRAVVIDPIDDLERNAANACSRISRSRRPAPSSCSSATRRSGCCRRSARAAALLRLRRSASDAMTSALRPRCPMRTRRRSSRSSRSGRARRAAPSPFAGSTSRRSTRRCDALARDGDPTNARRAALAQSLGAQVGPAPLRGVPRPRPGADRRGSRSAAAPAAERSRSGSGLRASPRQRRRQSLDPQHRLRARRADRRARPGSGASAPPPRLPRRGPAANLGFIGRPKSPLVRTGHGRTLLHHDRDQLSQRPAAYRPCL